MNRYILAAIMCATCSAAYASTEIEVPPGGWVTIGVTAPNGATITVDSSAPNDPPPPTEQPLPVLINAGGTDYTDRSGRLWRGESSFVNGGAAVNRGSIEIERTDDDTIYRTERWGKATYAVPLKPGRYDVRLHYAETYYSAPGRHTGATVEGRSLEPADIYQLAGGARKAITRTVRDVAVNDGTLNIALIGAGPMLNGIEVAAANTLPPDQTFEPPAPPPSDGGNNGGGSGNSGGASDITQSEQCDASKVPPLARERGMSKLVFCEDFSDPKRINLTTTALGAGQTMVQNHIFSAKLNPPDRFTFKDGIITLRPTNSNYQGHLITTEKGGKKGFQLRGAGWYVEARLRHLGDYTNWPGCTAFWSMDADHLYGTETNPVFAEPDFFEWINGNVRALHAWQRGGNGKKAYPSEAVQLGKNFDPKQWFVAGALLESDYSAYRWHRNDRIEGSKSPSWLRSVMQNFNGPIIVGSGSACPFQIDYIRAWSK